ncbi:MAG: LytTR family DNA-binding domain-containing protein [Bacteroidota bacterium]
MKKETNIKAVVIDDEPGARETLTALLEQFFPAVEVAATAEDGRSGLRCIETYRPELVFLDIEMPGLSGIELLDTVQYRDFEVIITTAYRDYTLAAIKYSALDYLLKPIQIKALSAAIEKARKKRHTRTLNARIRLLEEHLMGRNDQNRRIALPSGEGLMVVPIREIVRCEGDSNYTHFFFATGKKLTVTKTLREYEELLGDAGFFRIFQSHLISLYHVTSYRRGRGGHVQMSDGNLLPVSRNRKKELIDRLTDLK